MKKLNVRKTSISEVRKMWGIPAVFESNELYIRCNSKGDVRWDIAPVYTGEELIQRDNVTILN